MEDKRTTPAYKIIRWLVWFFYPKLKVSGSENIPTEASVIVGNHTQMNGPIAAEFYCPGRHYTWCAGQMMHLKDVPDYAFQDFWSRKPKSIRWLYRLLSYAIAPLSVCVFNNAHTVAVYRDARIMSTFCTTLELLEKGNHIVIFPEHDVEYNHILYEFQDKFVDVARMYYRKTGKELSFVPLYIAPALKTMYFGKPIRYCADNSPEEERRRICRYLTEEITAIACALPEHTVVPYRNVPKKYYTTNILRKVHHAKTSR